MHEGLLQRLVDNYEQAQNKVIMKKIDCIQKAFEAIMIAITAKDTYRLLDTTACLMVLSFLLSRWGMVNNNMADMAKVVIVTITAMITTEAY